MAYFYTYMDPAEIEAQFKDKLMDDEEDEGRRKEKPELEMVKREPVEWDNEYDTGRQTRM